MRAIPHGFRRLARIYPFLAMAATLLVSVAVLVPSLVYSGRQAEAYSLGNHFLSELGQVGVSRAAWVFNAGLVACGVLYVPCLIGMGLHIGSPWSLLGMVSGVCAGIFLAGVGFFPMNNLPPHAFTAMWFFRMGLVTILLFGAAFIAQPRGEIRVRKTAAVFSVMAVAVYAAFLVMAAGSKTGAHPLDASTFANRPALWPLAAMEWAVFFATILWFLAVSLSVKRTRTEGGTSI